MSGKLLPECQGTGLTFTLGQICGARCRWLHALAACLWSLWSSHWPATCRQGAADQPICLHHTRIWEHATSQAALNEDQQTSEACWEHWSPTWAVTCLDAELSGPAAE